MQVTLIITTFNWPQSLVLSLKSVEKQTMIPDEIIIADDGSNEKTQESLSKFQESSSLNIIHSWQKDMGFRAAASRNRAIAKSSGEYIILIDGDMLLHPYFVQDHLFNSEQGCYIQGSRVLINKKQSKKTLNQQKIDYSFFTFGLKNRKNAIHSNLMSRIFTNISKKIVGIKSCNMSFYKSDCLSVNGFNNDFEGWGREDSEFIIRLFNNGINRKNIYFNAIQFHLWHDENSREMLVKNNKILEKAIFNNSLWCENGINKFL